MGQFVEGSSPTNVARCHGGARTEVRGRHLIVEDGAVAKNDSRLILNRFKEPEEYGILDVCG
jgi:hypothetical protein